MGFLITFEGIEGAGKTTQIERSRDWLQHHFNNKIPIVTTREPGGTILGQELRRLLLAITQPIIPTITQPIIQPTHTTELLLYAADRAQHVEEMLKPELERGAIVLCDRYTDSTIAYQGFGRGIDLKLINSLNEIAIGGLESHLTFWLDLEVEIGLKRVQERGKQRDRMEESDLAFHQRVRQGFTQLAAQNPDRIVKIDARPSAAEVQVQIQQILRKFFRERE